MKPLLFALATMLAASAFAADTPTFGTTPSAPTASEQISAARQAIERKNWSRAQSDLKSVVRDEPNNADAHNLLAYTYRKQDKPDLAKAFEHYKTALKLNPQHKGAHEYIGEAYLMDRKPDLAEQHLASLEKICGNRQCEEYRDLAKSVAAYRKANP